MRGIQREGDHITGVSARAGLGLTLIRIYEDDLYLPFPVEEHFPKKVQGMFVNVQCPSRYE